MKSPILVTGGTGTLGGHVVPLLREAGPDVRVLSRRSREPADGVEYVVGDLPRDEGVDAAVAGAEVVLAAPSRRGRGGPEPGAAVSRCRPR